MGFFFGIPAPQPQYMHCPECGQCIRCDEADGHECDRERVLDYQIMRMRPDIHAFEHDFYMWLGLSNEGRFLRYYCERDRLRSQILGRERVAA